MPSKQSSASDAVAQFQRQAQEALRAQQQAYLAAVKSWRENLTKDMPPPWPQPPGTTLGPKQSEVAEASYAFVAKLLADQGRFMEELSKALTGGESGAAERTKGQ